MPPDSNERVGSHYGQERSPVDHPRKHDECESGGIVQAARPDVALDVERQLLAKEEILGCETGVGCTDQRDELQETTYEKECAANRPCRS